MAVSAKLRTFTAQTWPVSEPGAPFPEQSRPEIMAKPNVGLCFSGGGTRSVSASLGQLRALNALNLLSKVRYISCVSGGSWAAVPYTYLPANITDDVFLGPVVEPQNITYESLGELDTNCLGYACTHADIMDKVLALWGLVPHDEVYSRSIGEIVLKPFGLQADALDDQNKFFSYDNQSVQSIIQRNPDLDASQFYTVRDGRPFLIANGTLIYPTNLLETENRLLFEYTPLYVGTPVYYPHVQPHQRPVGGGFLEPFAFKSNAPTQPPGADNMVSLNMLTASSTFELSDIVGSSGAAYAECVDKIDPNLSPAFMYWPVQNMGQVPAYRYSIGDGGNLENYGIMALLQRRVESIIVFINSEQPLTAKEIDAYLPPLFGVNLKDSPYNQIFSSDLLQPLWDALLTAQSNGGVAMHQAQYTVLDNPFFGIESYDVEVLWVHLSRVSNWENQLNTDIQQRINNPGAGFKHFPNYLTVFQNLPDLIQLTPQQVNLSAHLTCWSILQNSDHFTSFIV